jgi:putative addiction module component (TIGR02574 family)
MKKRINVNIDMNNSLQIDILQLSPPEQLEIVTIFCASLASSKQFLSLAQRAETRRRPEQVHRKPQSTLSSGEMWRESGNLRNDRND